MKTLLSLLGLTMSGLLFAQSTYITRDAYIRFFSSTPVEDIEAVNNQVSSILDIEKGSLAFQVPIKAFKFEKALMQEHFNENYMESNKFPNATFKGQILNPEVLSTIGNQPMTLKAKGILNIHGVDKEITEAVTVSKVDGKFRIESKFFVSPADFNIAIPGAVRNKIAEKIEVSLKAQYEAKP